MRHRFTIRPKDLGQFEKSLVRNFDRVMERAALSTAMRSVGYLQERTRSAVPANPAGIGEGGAFDRGTYLRRWRARKYRALMKRGAVVFNNSLYAGIIEYGRRPGKFPPVNVIRRWVQRRLGIQVTTKTEDATLTNLSEQSRARGIAYLVSRAIARRGLLGRHVMTHVVAQLWMARAFEQEIQRAYDTAVAAAARTASRGSR